MWCSVLQNNIIWLLYASKISYFFQFRIFILFYSFFLEISLCAPLHHVIYEIWMCFPNRIDISNHFLLFFFFNEWKCLSIENVLAAFLQRTPNMCIEHQTNEKFRVKRKFVSDKLLILLLLKMTFDKKKERRRNCWALVISLSHQKGPVYAIQQTIFLFLSVLLSFLFTVLHLLHSLYG